MVLQGLEVVVGHSGCKRELDALGIVRAAVDAFPDGFALHRVVRDSAGRIARFTLEMINQAGASGFSTDPAGLVGVDVAELLGPSCAPMIDAFRRCAETGETQRVRTTFMESPAAGTTDSIVLRLNDDILLSTWRDVTEHIVAHDVVEEALRHRGDAWQDLKDAFDAMKDGIVVLRLPGQGTDVPPSAGEAGDLQVLFMNEVAATGLGVSHVDSTGRTLNELAGAEAATWLRVLVARAIAAGDEVSERVVMTDADGRVTGGRVITARTMSRQRVLVVSRDISHELWAAPGEDSDPARSLPHPA